MLLKKEGDFINNVIFLFVVQFFIIVSSNSIINNINNIDFNDDYKKINIIQENMTQDYNEKITVSQLCEIIKNFEQNTVFNFEYKKKIYLSDEYITKYLNSNIYDENVKRCAEKGILNLNNNKIYKPDDYIKKQELAVIIYNIANNMSDMIYNDNINYKNNNLRSSPYMFPHIFFDSNHIKSWARSEINWIYRKGIMQEDKDNNFNPEKYCTFSDIENSFLNLYKSYYGKNKEPESEYYPVIDNFFDFFYNEYQEYIDIYAQCYNKYDINKVYPFYKKYHKIEETEVTEARFDNVLYYTYLYGENFDDKLISEINKITGENYGNPIFGTLDIRNDIILMDSLFINMNAKEFYKGIYLDYITNSDSYFKVKEDLNDYMFLISANTGKYGYLNNSKNIYKAPEYELAGCFNSGKAIVKNRNNTFSVIDEDFNIIETLKIYDDNLTREQNKYRLNNIRKINGEYIVMQDKDSKRDVLYKFGKGYITDFKCVFTNIYFPSNGQPICYYKDKDIKDVYVLINKEDGEIISNYYSLREINKNRYIIQYEENGDYILIDEKGNEIRNLEIKIGTLITSCDNVSESQDSLQGDNSLFVYKQTEKMFVVIDYYGDIIGRIMTTEDANNVEIINGLISLGERGYYFPTGERPFY